MAQQPEPTISLPPNLPTSLQILFQKQQEYSGLQALKEAAGDMVARVEQLAEMSHIMADGGEAVGSVLRNWPHVFGILNLFDRPVTPPASPGGTKQYEEEPPEPLPQLVRLPYNSTSTETPQPPA